MSENEYTILWRNRWGIAMLAVNDWGFSISLHHEYPHWTCRLWKDVGNDHTDVTAKAMAPLTALVEALEKATDGKWRDEEC